MTASLGGLVKGELSALLAAALRQTGTANQTTIVVLVLVLVLLVLLVLLPKLQLQYT